MIKIPLKPTLFITDGGKNRFNVFYTVLCTV